MKKQYNTINTCANIDGGNIYTDNINNKYIKYKYLKI